LDATLIWTLSSKAPERNHLSLASSLSLLFIALQDNLGSTPPWQIQKGTNASHADDTKGLKGVIIDWITPAKGSLEPQLNHKHKFESITLLQGHFDVLLASIGTDLSKRSGLPSLVILGYANMNGSIKEKPKSGEMYVRGDQWPLFLYVDENFDPKREVFTLPHLS
jgi:hypothetical protein